MHRLFFDEPHFPSDNSLRTVQRLEGVIAVKHEPISTLFPVDTVRGKSVRPIRQQLAIIGGVAYVLALFFSFLPKG